MQDVIWFRIRNILDHYKKQCGCLDCGTNTGLLDFDHEGTEGIKKFRLSMGRSRTPQAVWEEFDKCKVRCRSCHMKRHAADPVWREKVGSPKRGRKTGPMSAERKLHLSTIMKGRLFR